MCVHLEDRVRFYDSKISLKHASSPSRVYRMSSDIRDTGFWAGFVLYRCSE